MDISKLKRGILERIGRYKYVLLVLLIGMLLMMLPDRTNAEQENLQVTDTEQSDELDTAQELEAILMNIHGAGRVMVMLTEAQGQRTIYQTDTVLSEKEGSTDSKTQTIVVTDSNRNEYGLIHQENPPIYLGAIVVAQGAENPAVKLAIVDAVSKATGLGADKISVLKMK